MNTTDAFEKWWSRVGRTLDPDTSEVSWYDKRKGLAALAFEAATAQSRNYVADDPVAPTEFVFANGRRVTVESSDGSGILRIGHGDYPDIAAPSPETGTAAVPPRFDGEDYLRAMPGGHTMPAGPATEPVKPPATWEPCEWCNGDGDWLPAGACGACEHCPNPVKCSACNGTGRTPAAGTAPKGEK